jgi:hypothetical protein
MYGIFFFHRNQVCIKVKKNKRLHPGLNPSREAEAIGGRGGFFSNSTLSLRRGQGEV